jgi:anti-sigma factor ChrR (cupin superfamily)
MTMHQSLDEARERVALYALGTLRGTELADFESHLQSGCDVCSDELRAFTAVAGELAHAAAPERPPDRVRARVLEHAASDALAAQAIVEREHVRFVRSSRLDWKESIAAGVDVKVLSVDPQRGYETKLVRMPPGSELLPHRHADVEESYVLEGDLLVSGVLMGPGDYCRAEAGSVHTGVETRGGCLFIAVTSQHDEVLA